jgi:hypothetical protein
VQVENTLQVAEEMGCALLNPGGVFVELVPAHVVITHDIAGIVTQDSEVAQRDLRGGQVTPGTTPGCPPGCAR